STPLLGPTPRPTPWGRSPCSSRGHRSGTTPADVGRLPDRARGRRSARRSLPHARRPREVERVSDLHPRLDRTLPAAGVASRGDPRMSVRSHVGAAAEAPGGRVRVTQEPEDLVTARAVTAVAFGRGWTETGPAGAAGGDEARGRV